MAFTLWTIASSRSAIDYPFDLYYTGLLGNIVMFLVAYGSSYIIKPTTTLLTK
jgi:SSS family solute:Na+ symporter